MSEAKYHSVRKIRENHSETQNPRPLPVRIARSKQRVIS